MRCAPACCSFKRPSATPGVEYSMPSCTENGATARCARLLARCVRSSREMLKSGEPSAVQILRYFACDWRGRVRRM